MLEGTARSFIDVNVVMSITQSQPVIGTNPLLPKYINYKIPPPEYLVHDDFEIMSLIVINRHPNTAVLGEQFAKQLRSEEHTSELQSLMRISYAVFCLKKKNDKIRSDIQLYLIHLTICTI